MGRGGETETEGQRDRETGVCGVQMRGWGVGVQVVVPDEDLSESLLDARSPDAAYQAGPRRYPYLSALGLHAGAPPPRSDFRPARG